MVRTTSISYQIAKKTLNDKKKPSLVVGSNPVAVVNNDSYDRENETIQSFWSEQTNTGSHKTNLYSLFLAYRNSQVLLKVGITATILALIASIYGIIQANTSAPNNSESHDKNSSTF